MYVFEVVKMRAVYKKARAGEERARRVREKEPRRPYVHTIYLYKARRKRWSKEVEEEEASEEERPM